MNPIEQIQDSIRSAFPEAIVELDGNPVNVETGYWFLDVTYGTKSLVVEWRPQEGFGISVPPHHFGVGPDQMFENQEAALEEINRILNAE